MLVIMRKSGLESIIIEQKLGVEYVFSVRGWDSRAK